MKKPHAADLDFHSLMLERLEDRIAPAAAVIPAGIDFSHVRAADAGSNILLHAGETLGTSDSGGVYYLYVQQGEALVFTTDLNGDNQVDANEITGISAGDGLKLISFVNINGDIVTNLTKQGVLTDSDGDASNGRDGKVVLDSHIESITMRSVAATDFPTSNDPDTEAHNRVALSSYSIYGNIYAGGGLGSSSSTGLVIDTSGFTIQNNKYTSAFGISTVAPTPSIGFIYTGSAVSGKYFSFGTSPDFMHQDDSVHSSEAVRGTLASFSPAGGEAGGDVIGIHVGEGTATTDPLTGLVSTVFTPVDYHIAGIYTGTGGFGAKGGDIIDVSLAGDVGGFKAIAGDGGDGVTGGDGGSILEFSVATNSINSLVTLHTGSGGAGFIGAAGSAGTVSIDGDVKMYGNITIGLGDGGDGLKDAGSGTSLTHGNFELVDIGTPTAVQLVSTYRLPGDLDRTRPVDFDGDGYTDAVFISDLPQQLVVLFGNGFGGFDLDRTQYLDASTYATADKFRSAVEVGDFNGDGKLDIVTGSSTGTDFAGVKTFINLTDADHPDGGIFSDARYSPLPSLTGIAITNLAVGDYNDDGILDVGVLYAGQGAKAFTDLAIMSGIKGPDFIHSDGYFAANFDKGSTTSAKSDPIIGYAIGSVPAILKATAAVKGDITSDLIVALYLVPNKADISTFQMVDNDSGGLKIHEETVVLSQSTRTYNTTDHKIDFSFPKPVSATDFSIIDVVDGVGTEGVFDVVVVGMADGSGIMQIVQGQDDGSVSQPDANGVLIDSIDPKLGAVITGDIKLINILGAVKSSFSDPTANNEFSVNIERNVASNPYNPHTDTIYVFTIDGFNNFPDGTSPVINTDSTGGYAPTASSLVGQTVFDSFYTKTEDYGVESNAFAGGTKTVDQFGNASVAIGGPSGDANSAPVATNSLTLLAGNGGNSLLGHGGSGGSIGSGTTSTKDDTTGVVSVTPNVDITHFITATLVTGRGGSGFLSGGDAGSIIGLSNRGTNLTYTTNSGGNALFGKGGNGGSVSQLFLIGESLTPDDLSNLTLSTGNGGFGLQGGVGGSILGRGDVTNLDAEFDSYDLSAGSGGDGINSGGDGGSITSFLAQYGDGGNGGILANLQYALYYSGNGGSAVSGVGGKGGTLGHFTLPTTAYNASDGEIILQAGRGGDGLTGGAGGSVLDFINSPTGLFLPDLIYVTTGNGGRGVTGNGGAGGSIQDVSVTAIGTRLTFDLIDGVSMSPTVNAMIAGDGGLSSAGTGGAGGSLLRVTTSSTAGAAVGAAGAGGDGLVAGGAGGNLTTMTLNGGGLDNARVLGIAGKGGDGLGVTQAQLAAEHSVANPLFDPLIALGSTNGKGGNGGSINGFIQSSHISTSTDLIAGNGGSTINYGLISSTTSGVGNGGSISHVNLQGDSGIIARDVAIKGYSPTFVSDLVSQISSAGADSFVFADDNPNLLDTDGNVGVLVGSKGFIRNGLPTSVGSAGSVTDFKAKNIMSMVAGSVENIASIASISDVTFQNGTGIFGAIKDFSGPNGTDPVTHGGAQHNLPAYYSNAHYVNETPGEFISHAPPGGSLADGAILAATSSNSPSGDGRVFFSLAAQGSPSGCVEMAGREAV